MRDGAGFDEMIIAVSSTRLTSLYEHVKNYTDLPGITVRQIEHFFAHYKDLEPQVGQDRELGRCNEARRNIAEAIGRARAARKA